MATGALEQGVILMFHLIINFEFRIFAIMLNAIFNTRPRLKISWFHVYYSMGYFVVFIKYVIKFIDVHIFDTAVICV